MTTGNETRDTGVTNEMLDRLLEQRVAAVQRQIAADRAREEWPVNVNEALRLLTEKIKDLQTRLAAVESGRG